MICVIAAAWVIGSVVLGLAFAAITYGAEDRRQSNRGR